MSKLEEVLTSVSTTMKVAMLRLIMPFEESLGLRGPAVLFRGALGMLCYGSSNIQGQRVT
jgi:hypothetical protein